MTADRARWFIDARFGLFVHWGLYSIPAGVWKGRPMGRNWYAEWIQTQGNWPNGIPASEYRDLARQFHPDRFDPDDWIREAASAGMKYFVVTAKHHDGFALWPSKSSRFNVVDSTPLARDVLGDLAAAGRRHGLAHGFYYSHWQDWEHPDGARPPWPEVDGDPAMDQPTDDRFERYWQEKCLPQVAELIERYHPRLFWFDTWSKASHLVTEKRIDELIGLVRRLDPDCLVNSRIGSTWNHRRGDDVVDYRSMGDNEFPETRIDRPWETSGTIQRSWGWHRLDFDWKPTVELLKNLIANASRNGNYQLNVGPMADGRFPAPAIRRLREIGAWLAANGESIYGTGPNPLADQDWGRITARSLPTGFRRLYLHLFDAAPGRAYPVKSLGTLPSNAFVLETGQPVAVEKCGDEIRFQLPAEARDPRIPVVVFEMEPT